MILGSRAQRTVNCREGLNSKISLGSNHRWTSIVPPNFVNDFAVGDGSGYENYPAWFMDIAKDRVTIIKQESRMNPLAALSEACKDLIIIER